MLIKAATGLIVEPHIATTIGRTVYTMLLKEIKGYHAMGVQKQENNTEQNNLIWILSI